MNIDQWDDKAETWADKLDRGSKWLAWGCAAVMLYVLYMVIK
jgi:hypothetical protein